MRPSSGWRSGASRAACTGRGRSRTRGLWKKGETSGHVLEVVSLALDCDRDAVLALVRPRGPTCHLGTTTSSARYKQNIQPMDKASEAILALKPVTFRYKHELDAEGIPQFGLVAEDVEKVNPDLVARDDQGKPYTVRYEAVNAMLLNEFLKEHRKVETLEAKMAQQQSTNADQQKAIQSLIATVKEQASQMQKVSEQLAINSPLPRLVLNNP